VIGFTLLFSVFLACLVTFTLGLSRYLDYRDQVLTCVEDKIGNQQHYLANSVSSKNEEFLLVVLKRVEERCDFTQHDYLGLVLHHEDDERVDFFWVVSDREDEWLRVGKDLLVGPEISRLYPLSSWPEYGKGEYWLGDIRGTFYFGGYLESLVSVYSKILIGQILFLCLCASGGLLIAYIIYTRKALIFGRSIKTRNLTQRLRERLGEDQNEITDIWHAIIQSQEKYEEQIFSLNTELRSLQQALDYAAKGSLGKTLTMTLVSNGFKRAARPLVIESARLCESIDDADKCAQLDNINAYFRAFLSVSSDVYDRGIVHANEANAQPIACSLYAVLAQVLDAYQARIEVRDIQFEIDLTNDLPHYLEIDPVILKRVLLAAFETAMRHDDIQELRFSLRIVQDQHEENTLRFELVSRVKTELEYASSNQASNQTMHQTKQTSHPKQKTVEVDPYVERLCSLLQANWGINQGLKGQLSQWLEMPVNEAAEFRDVLEVSGDVKGLSKLRIMLLSAGSAALDRLSQFLNGPFMVSGSHDSAELLFQVLQAPEALAELDVIVMTDCLRGVACEETVNQLRVIVGAKVPIVMLTHAPELGDADLYRVYGASVYLAISDLNDYLIELIAMSYRLAQTDIETPPMLTRFSLLDSEVDSECKLPSRFQRRGKGRLLLITPDLVTIEVVKQLCMPEHIDVMYCLNGFEAIELFKKELFDLVMIDDSLTDIDTVSVAGLLRQIEQGRVSALATPIVTLDESCLKKELEYRYEHGINECLTKPITLSQLSLVFKEFLN
jgi:CheY-like chemotaxis protein/signal transduction histidine kinase